MFGDDGNDFLDGGEDEDIMTGGLGDDTYIVDNVSDLVTEVSEAGSGDTVKASINYTLGASLENLTLTGSSAINGTGNGLNNIITGNSGDNILDGGTGADTVVFNGSSGEYLFSLNETLQLVVTDLIAGRDGKDTLAKAEYLSFNNIQLNASEVIAGKNAPPTDLTLTLTSVGIAENGIAGTLIGTLSATDPDAGSTFSYTLVAGDGTNDADNNLVEIVGSQVKVKIGASIDFETNSTLNLNIKVTDNGTPGLTYTKAVTAAVLNVNDAPTVNAILPLQTINRSSNFSYALPSNLFLDLDSTPTLSATTTTGASLPSWLTFNASTGIFTGTPSSSGTVALNISASDGLTSVSTPLELKIREVQLISSLSKPITYQRNKDLIVPINYSTTDGSKNTGISFNVYFNSSLLSFDATTGIANKVQADLFNVGAIQADTANSDGDSSTDKFIPISLAGTSKNCLST